MHTLIYIYFHNNNSLIETWHTFRHLQFGKIKSPELDDYSPHAESDFNRTPHGEISTRMPKMIKNNYRKKGFDCKFLVNIFHATLTNGRSL